MTTTIKEIIAGVLVALGIAFGAGVVWSFMHPQLEQAQADLKTANDQIEGLQLAASAAQAAQATNAAQRARVAAQTKERNEALATALTSNQDWASVPVPAAAAQPRRRG